MTKNYVTKKNNFNNNSSNGKNQKPRKKPEIQMFHKTFESFDDVLEEILLMPGQLSDDINNILEDFVGRNKLDELNFAIVDLFALKYPNIQLGENCFWALNMSYDRCFLKTGYYVAIGWIIEREYVNGNNEIKSIDVTFTSYDPSKTVDELAFMEDHNWERKSKNPTN